MIFMRDAGIKKKVFALTIFIFTAFGGLSISGAVQAKAATKCYTIGNANVQVYSNTGLSRNYGTIYPSDEITVHTVTDRYCKVTYPISRGTKTGYISTGKILTRTMGSSYASRAKITTYRRVGGSSYGYIAKGDSVKVLGASGNYTQVKYPVSGGYKYAFVKTSELNAYVLPSAGGRAGGVSAATVPNGIYKVVSALNGNYVMDVNGASSADSANVQLYEDNGTNAQKFRFTRQADGSYIICNVNSGKVLDCAGAGKTNGTNIQQHTSNGTAAQRWKVTSAGAGCYTITCKCNGLVADVNGARAANNTNIQMYKSNGTTAQKWKLVPTTPESKSDLNFAALKAKYPNYSYWNGSYHNLAWQCHGFALTLGEELTGSNPNNWKKVYNLNTLKRGDIIRCKRPHTIMVTAVSGNTITYVDCNWVAPNKVKWDQTIQRSRITGKFGSLQYVMVCPK